MSTDCIIREYKESDRHELVDMNIELVDLMSTIDPHKRFRPRNEFDSEKDMDLLLKELETKEGKIFIVESDGRVGGYAIGIVDSFGERDVVTKYPTKQGYIDAFFVKEELRGKNIAKDLLKAVEDYFRDIGCEHSSVACVAVNIAAKKFYEKTGYAEQYINYLKKL